MCPRCNRGLVKGEICPQCKGTGFWNPDSLSVNEVQVMDAQNVEVPVEAAPVVEAPAVEPAVEVEVAPDAGVQAPVVEEPKEEVVA